MFSIDFLWCSAYTEMYIQSLILLICSVVKRFEAQMAPMYSAYYGELTTLVMAPDETISRYFERANELRYLVEVSGKTKHSDLNFCTNIMNGLPLEYDGLKQHFDLNKNTDPLCLNPLHLMSLLEKREWDLQQAKLLKEKRENEALVASVKATAAATVAAAAPSDQQHKQHDLSSVKCFKCQRYGHYARNCYSKSGGNFNRNKQSRKNHFKKHFNKRKHNRFNKKKQHNNNNKQNGNKQQQQGDKSDLPPHMHTK